MKIENINEYQTTVLNAVLPWVTEPAEDIYTTETYNVLIVEFINTDVRLIVNADHFHIRTPNETMSVSEMCLVGDLAKAILDALI